ncbi:hypothetical protein [Flavobacterium sp.]|uniref:hypothetical protein n=1 Tax=Flavobacterium sp. TaxID=239 RepID=UPI00391C6950
MNSPILLFDFKGSKNTNELLISPDGSSYRVTRTAGKWMADKARAIRFYLITND